MSTSVISFENLDDAETQGPMSSEFEGHDTYSRRSVELICMPRTLHSTLRFFSMTLLARINLDSTQQLKLL